MASRRDPNGLIRHAERACRSARLLLDDGDLDGARSRAYFAIFDAASAAVLMTAPDRGPDIRTHAGLIRRFGLEVVKPGYVRADLGRLIGQAQQLRRTADYAGEEISQVDAANFVAAADTFVQEIRARFIDGRG